jgi:hypothetical protein
MWLRSCISVLVAVHLACNGQIAWANEVDEEGNLIATPREAAMMERGFLFYPPRVVRKPGESKPLKAVATPVAAPTSLAAPTPTTPPASEPVPDHVPPEPVSKIAEPTIEQAMVKVEPPAATPALPATPIAARDKILITKTNNRLSAPAVFEQLTAYAGAGTGVVVGLNLPQANGQHLRVEYSDSFKTLDMRANDGGGRFTSSTVQQRLGLFLDWSPNQDNWFVTGGLTLNNHSFKLKSKAADAMTINGQTVVFTNETFNVDFSLPKVTPYIGVRYVLKPFNNKGWEGYAELGMILSKMDSDVSVSQTLIDSAQVADSDIQSEVRALRKSIYKWDVVPNALVGLSYRY